MAIPLIAAYGAVSAGIAAGAATLVGGMMIAGGVLGAIGAVTGNQKLQMFGGALSLVGGVANLASAATSQTASGLANVAAEQATAGTESIAAEGLGQTAASTAAAPVADGAVDALTESAATGSVVADGGGGAASEMAGAPASVAGGEAPVAASAVQQTPQISASPLAGAPVEQATAGTEYLPQTNGAGGSGLISGSSTQPSLLDKFASATKNNPELTKAASGLISGAANAYGQQQQVQALRDSETQRENYLDKLRQRYSDSVRNLQIPTFSTQVPRTGIINSAKV
jgi:hypothetical protein